MILQEKETTVITKKVSLGLPVGPDGQKKKQATVILRQNSSETYPVDCPQGGANPVVSERTSRTGTLRSSISLPAMMMAVNFTKKFKDVAMSRRRDRERERPKGILLENNYRMEPERDTKFSCRRVKMVVDDSLELLLSDKKYIARDAPKLACSVSNSIKVRIKDMRFDRYKLVCHVMIGPASCMDMRATSRCLWDHTQDNYVTCTFNNENIAAVATVYGVYFE